MDKKLKEELIKRLRRTGETRYIQGAGKLRQTVGVETQHCCLGVLADIVDPDAWKTHPEKERAKGFNWDAWTDGEGYEHVDQLPDEIIDSRYQSTLIHMNDTGASFLKIANWIKKNVIAD